MLLGKGLFKPQVGLSAALSSGRKSQRLLAPHSRHRPRALGGLLPGFPRKPWKIPCKYQLQLAGKYAMFEKTQF